MAIRLREVVVNHRRTGTDAGDDAPLAGLPAGPAMRQWIVSIRQFPLTFPGPVARYDFVVIPTPRTSDPGDFPADSELGGNCRF